MTRSDLRGQRRDASLSTAFAIPTRPERAAGTSGVGNSFRNRRTSSTRNMQVISTRICLTPVTCLGSPQAIVFSWLEITWMFGMTRSFSTSEYVLGVGGQRRVMKRRSPTTPGGCFLMATLGADFVVPLFRTVEHRLRLPHSANRNLRASECEPRSWQPQVTAQRVLAFRCRR